jgi:hypothetical protein
MNNTLTTAPAQGTSRQELVTHLIDVSRQKALEEAGKSERKVSEVKKIQKDKLREIIEGAKGTDGAATVGNLTMTGELEADLTAGIEKDHTKRMQSVEETPDAYIFKRVDATAGVQHDDSRKVGIAHDVMADPKAAEKVSLHEGEHQNQEAGAQVAALPPTGNPVIDKDRHVSRLALRENLSIKAEGGLSNHTPEYFGYVEKANAYAEVLDDAGQNGKAMVEEAGRTVEGFEKMHEAMYVASIQKALKTGALEDLNLEGVKQ